MCGCGRQQKQQRSIHKGGGGTRNYPQGILSSQSVCDVHPPPQPFSVRSAFESFARRPLTGWRKNWGELEERRVSASGLRAVPDHVYGARPRSLSTLIGRQPALEHPLFSLCQVRLHHEVNLWMRRAAFQVKLWVLRNEIGAEIME